MEQVIKDKDFTATFNEDLDGYVVEFTSGHIAQTQITIEENRLHADYGKRFLERYTEYDDELTDEENVLMDKFVENFGIID